MDFRDPVGEERDVALVGLQMDLRLRNVLRHPLTVGKRHEPVVLPVPQLKRHPNLGKLEPPRFDAPEVVLLPAFRAGRQPLLTLGMEKIQEIVRQRGLVDLGQERGEKLPGVSGVACFNISVCSAKDFSQAGRSSIICFASATFASPIPS